MRVLGIDTATSVASVSLIEDGELIAEQFHPSQESQARSTSAHPKSNHAEIILPLIESVLNKAGAALTDIAGIAVSIGPGSFTGVRIGLSTVKGLAYGGRIPVVGVSTLLANGARVTDFDGLICSFLDARKNEVYAALFRRTETDLTRLTEDLVAPAEAAIETARTFAQAASCLFIGDGVQKYEKKLLDSLGNGIRLSTGSSYSSLASSLARLGADRLRISEGDDLGTLAPVYLRPPEAEASRISHA